MLLQVIVSPVMHPAAFSPSKAVKLDFNIPCIISIECSLRVKMLPNSYSFLRNAKANELFICQMQAPRICFCLDMLMLQCIFQGNHFHFKLLLLVMAGIQRQLLFFHSFKCFPIIFFFRINKQLRFCLGEFPQSKKMLPGADLIPVCFPNLEHAKWNLPEVIFQLLEWKIRYSGS